ncbi:hypothetical protein [Luteimonas deserti]|uniref:Flagellar FliJ protein n=1 Tax=Luteimonas deserti TaxID=2752306 RepID=A0A7Z0QRD6_9GAMM|nr:hypothetical protein [Luteimonas deserti]NYZ62103.1 hypothetical protein [Luteimonas deserti]
MKRYPLQTLLQLREHRTDAARMVVLEKRRALAQCVEARTRVQGELSGLESGRRTHRARLLDPPPPGVPWPAAMSQREAHIDLLGEQIAGARQRLSKAQEAVRQAEVAVQEARDAFFRAKGRQDALETRRDRWTRDQRALLERHEEAVNEDLMQARHHLARPH